MIRRIFLVLFLLLFGAHTTAAQNWSFDARKVALGSPGSGENLASRAIDEERDYRALVLPFGLIQLFRDFRSLNPENDEFDLVHAIEYGASPLHYTKGRNSGDSRADDFIVDVGNGELSRDLNDYKGLVLVNQPVAEGLASPN